MIDLELLDEGSFGPGTKQNVSMRDGNWKAVIGAIENKRRPEAVYIDISTWVTPNMSAYNSLAFEGEDIDELPIDIMTEFLAELKREARRFGSYFDPKLFNQSSILVTYDIAANRAKAGKSQFLEISLHIETINDIDDNGNPAPYKATGRVHELPFKEFERALVEAGNKILKTSFFAKNTIVKFSKTKKG